MILPDFILKSRKNKQFEYTGIDSPDNCLNKDHFNTYPHKISYQYNSRGFRDDEWPETIEELRECIWCFGDSFTVGIGSPLEHTWVRILQERTGKRCINISLDGASNNWISRKILRVIEEINPDNIVVQWSFAHRDESNDESLRDEDRRIHIVSGDLSTEDLSKRFKSCVQKVDSVKSDIVHSIIPDALYDSFKDDVLLNVWNNIKGPSWPDNPPLHLKYFPEEILNELKNDFPEASAYLHSYYSVKEVFDRDNFIEYDIVDVARDGFHYDIETATGLVDKIISCGLIDY